MADIELQTCDFCGVRSSHTHAVDTPKNWIACNSCYELEVFDCNGCHCRCDYMEGSIIKGLAYCPDCSAILLDGQMRIRMACPHCNKLLDIGYDPENGDLLLDTVCDHFVDLNRSKFGNGEMFHIQWTSNPSDNPRLTDSI